MYQQYSYSAAWESARPGCLIIMIDQSGSMDEQVGAGLVGAGSRKCDAASMVVNNVLKEVAKRCISGSITKPRVDIAVLGYGPGGSVHNALGGALARQDIVSVADLYSSPLRVNKVAQNEFDPETGQMVQTQIDVPIWVEPVADNGTPMCAAFDTAYQIAYNWVAGHTANFPPIIVNVTDGASTDGDPTPNASVFNQLATSDGAALVFNCHISSSPGYQVKYPYDLSQVPPDPLAQMLFQISSVLPDPMLSFANASYNMNLSVGARGFVFGGDIYDLTQFVTIATLAKGDPNR